MWYEKFNVGWWGSREQLAVQIAGSLPKFWASLIATREDASRKPTLNYSIDIRWPATFLSRQSSQLVPKTIATTPRIWLWNQQLLHDRGLGQPIRKEQRAARIRPKATDL